MSGAVGIAYLDGRRLSRCVLAAAEWVEAGRDELNRINVFPVPDGDTGTNFALTLRAVAEAVRTLETTAPLSAVARAMADAGIFGARGNSGMLLSQFLVGFSESLGDREAAGPADVARAMRAGADHVRAALEEPVEGTILTVCRDAASAAERMAPRTAGLDDLIRGVLDQAEDTLRHTPELLASLREAGVVDAGAQAFVRVLEGVVRFIDGRHILGTTSPAVTYGFSAAARAEVAAERDFQFCTEVLVRGRHLPPATAVRAALRPLGGSLVVSASGDLLKIHIHTNTPPQVFQLAAGWGELQATKAEDMREQHRRLDGGQADAGRRVAIVVDSSCDLPDPLLDQHGIVLVPLQVLVNGTPRLDRVEVDGAEIYARMRQGEAFSTSQPTPGAFVQAYQDALSGADQAVALMVSAALSGTFASAQGAARRSGLAGITVVDSRSVTLGLGMLALAAAELAAAGRSAEEIAREVGRIRGQSGGFFTVDTLDNLIRSGRVGRARGFIAGLLGLRPILELDATGKVAPLDRVRGAAALPDRVLQHLDRRLTPRPRRLRLGVVHADAPDVAERMRRELVRRYQPMDCLVAPVTAALGVHVGPGAWAVFYQVEDGGEAPRNQVVAN
ncbi:MAG TPA: DegV family protein [Gemmatimonadales bacterium]|nr:DegV family protein [Gemmatimonadales bacterium]